MATNGKTEVAPEFSISPPIFVDQVSEPVVAEPELESELQPMAAMGIAEETQAAEPIEPASEPIALLSEPIEAVSEPIEAVSEPIESLSEPVEAISEPIDSSQAVSEVVEAVSEPIGT